MQQMESLVEYGSRRVIITITAIICALLEIVDTTIVNVALKNMRQHHNEPKQQHPGESH